MKITSIEKQRKDSSRVSVFIDGEFSFGLSYEDALYYKLSENSEISKEKYDYIMNELVIKKAKEQALNFLSYRMRSKKEIQDRLTEKEYSCEVIEIVMEMLIKYNYIDDTSFAKAFINECANRKGWGKDRIGYELRLKGIDPQIIEEQISSQEICEKDNIIKIINKKTGGNTDLDFKEKRRIVSFLMRRGFSIDDINDAFNEL